MPIDAAIPLQAQSVKIESPINQLAGIGEAMKIGEMQRGVQTQNRLRDLYSQGIDVSTPEGFKQVAAIDPSTAIKLRADALQGRKLESDIKKTGVEIDQKTYDFVKQKMADLAFNPSDSNVKAHLEDGILRREVTPQQATQTWQAVSAMNPEQRKNYFTELGVKAETRYQADVTKRGQDLTNSATIRGQNMQYDPTIQGNIAAAKAGGEAVGKAAATARINLPDVIQTANDGIRLIDEMVGKPTVKDANGKVIQQGTAPHPGFKGYVGSGFSVGKGGVTVPGQRFIEGTDVAAFDLRQKQIEGKAFLEAFNALKGGGSITEKEGEKGTAAIMRMNKASTEAEYVSAARELQDVMRRGVEKAKTKASSSGAAPAGGEIDFNSLK